MVSKSNSITAFLCLQIKTQAPSVQAALIHRRVEITDRLLQPSLTSSAFLSRVSCPKPTRLTSGRLLLFRALQ